MFQKSVDNGVTYEENFSKFSINVVNLLQIKF